MELLIDFNGNKFAVRKTVNDRAGGKFNDRILTLNGRAENKKKKKKKEKKGMRKRSCEEYGRRG